MSLSDELASLYNWACTQYDTCTRQMDHEDRPTVLNYWGGKRQAYFELKLEINRRINE